MLEKLKDLLFGKDRNPLDPEIFRNISLMAFAAWVGLGADGISSSCYGPEQAFLALGNHPHLTLYLAILTFVTVFIISSSFARVIELFPTGGGAYLVASRLLGSQAGLVAGCALIISYILTIALSVASGVDAVFSFLPLHYQPFKMLAAAAVIVLLTYLNMRGVKESVNTLIPIFVVFVITHVVVIAYPIFAHLPDIPRLASDTVHHTRLGVAELGWWGLMIVLFRAYSLGAGTYTGIEAVSNAVPVLKEPRVETGKRTMTYLAWSLAVTAAGIMVGYLLMKVSAEPGRTLNATLLYRIVEEWNVGGLPLGKLFVVVTLLSEGALLFVAAQAGFIGGPRVLANMAVDSWAPHQFGNLSGRLVTLNGLILMGASALAILVFTGGAVSYLIVLYVISVFLAFNLSLGGLTRHFWRKRRTLPHWKRRWVIALVGTLLTGVLLAGMTVLRFFDGGWLTLVFLAVLMAGAFTIRRHYLNVRKLLKRLDLSLKDVMSSIPEKRSRKPSKDLKAPTAALMVSGYNGLGVHSLLSLLNLFPKQFKNVVFVSVGRIDSDRFKTGESVEELRFKVEDDLLQYVRLARRLGLYAECRYTMGTDTVEELEKLCDQVAKDFPRTVFFAGKLSFQTEAPWTRILHNQSALDLQRQLVFKGMNMFILPIRVY